MDNEIVSKVMEKLDAVADKLGVKAGQLWDVLIKQARIELITWIIQYSIYFMGMIAMYFFLNYAFSTFGSETFDIDEGKGIALVVATIVLCLISLIFTIVLACQLECVITCWFNPEFIALNKILHHF